MRTSRCLHVALLSLVLPVAALAESGAPPCVAGTSQTFSATGAVQTYNVPAGTTTVLITASGGSGGKGMGEGPSPSSSGAYLQAAVPVTGPVTLNVVVGKAGVDATDTNSAHGGGGGGGSFVFTSTGTLLLAAGGGGGGAGNLAGGNAQLGGTGASGGGADGGAGGSGGNGGAGGTSSFSGYNGGGGGGFAGAGGNGALSGGQGGHQISSPGDAAGGAGGTGGYAGGWGGGGGSDTMAGGGGGGYSGGGGGGGLDIGGGGGSFVAAGGTTYASSQATAPADGSVTICAISGAPPAGTGPAYGMDRTSTLYRFDPWTGVATAIGPLGIKQATGATSDPAAGVLYTNSGGCCGSQMASTGCLYSVSTATGLATLVGCDPNQGHNDPIKFAAGLDGVLYGARLACTAQPTGCHMYLCRVDRATGTLADIGDITQSYWCSGYGMTFGSDGKLYQWDSCLGLTIVSTTDATRTVFPATNFVGFPGPYDEFEVPDMGRDAAGVLWALVVGKTDGPNAYFTATVDTTTGDITYAATLPANIQTIDFDTSIPAVPALGGPGLILLGVTVAFVAVLVLAGRRLFAA